MITSKEISCHGKCKPPRLSGHRIVCNDKYVYSFGGFSNQNVNSTLVREMWRYHQYAHEWETIPMEGDIPTEVASSALALDKRVLYLLGGTGIPFGSKVNSHIYRCDLTVRDKSGAIVWEKVATFSTAAQYGQAVTVDNGYLYSVGGTDGIAYNMDVHRLDLSTFELEMISDSSGDQNDKPPGRYRAEVVAYEDELIVFGGGTAQDDGFDLQYNWVLDLTKRKWSLRESHVVGGTEFPLPRKCHSVCHLPGSEWAYVTGGLSSGCGLDDIWKFHLPTFTWHRIHINLPKPVFFHSSALTPTTNRLFTMGGVIDNRTGLRTSSISMIFIQVQLLQNLCLDMMPATRSPEHEQEIIANGVPRQLCWRLDAHSN